MSHKLDASMKVQELNKLLTLYTTQGVLVVQSVVRWLVARFQVLYFKYYFQIKKKKFLFFCFEF